MRDRVEAVLEQLRPALQADGGDVELVELTPDGVVKIRLVGACDSCSSAQVTLRMGIERALREQVPEVTGVEEV